MKRALSAPSRRTCDPQKTLLAAVNPQNEVSLHAVPSVARCEGGVLETSRYRVVLP